jgi:NAD(P)-dependent dehydrogenase (short-subunit alcohol dehydrogenase family)
MSKLTGKVAVVTASKGIGAAIAKSLASEGASVVVNYASSKAGADTVVTAIAAAGGKAVAVPLATSPRPPGRRASLKQPSRTSADPATSPPSPSFWRPKIPPGSPVNNFSLAVAFANP